MSSKYTVNDRLSAQCSITAPLLKIGGYIGKKIKNYITEGAKKQGA